MYQILLYFWRQKQKSDIIINTLFPLWVDECLMYVHAKFQDATMHKKVTRKEVELFD